MVKKVALFDFDNTVASGDTIKRLLKVDLKKHPWHCVYFFKIAFIYLLYFIHVMPFEKVKAAMLFPLKYMNNQQLQEFYEKEVVPTYYPNVVAQMQEKKDQGYIVILCTASSEIYMRYHHLPVDQLLGTVVDIKNGKVSIVGKNCKGKEKINRIEGYLSRQGIKIDYNNSYGYSDSDEDIPMLSLVKHKKRVLLKTGEIIDFQKNR